MNLTHELVERIQYEAGLSARPGQLDRLERLAVEVQDRITALEQERDQWQTQYEHAQERYTAEFQLNAELIAGLKKAQAAAWEEGHAAANGYDLSHELDRQEWEEEFALVRTTNPYREA